MCANALWVSSFTYVSTWIGSVYVVFIIDASAGSEQQRQRFDGVLAQAAALRRLAARADVDLNLTSTNQQRIDRLLTEATRLRRLYGVKVGTQRAAFFELQTDDFALLAIDTGIMRTVDERQWGMAGAVARAQPRQIDHGDCGPSAVCGRL